MPLFVTMGFCCRFSIFAIALSEGLRWDIEAMLTEILGTLTMIRRTNDNGMYLETGAIEIFRVRSRIIYRA